MPYNPVKAFLFLFYPQITFRTEMHKERSSQTRKRKKRERKNDSQTQRPNPRCSGEIAPPSSQFVLPISLFLDLPLPFELGLIVATPRRLRSQHRVDRNRSTVPHDLTSHRTQSPLSLPSSLNLTRFDNIFFLGFVCVSVLRNEWYYIFVWQLRKCEQQLENVFSIVFSRTQLNTRKYFSKHFLKCNQTLENIFLSRK